MIGFAGSPSLCQLTIYASAGGATVPMPGSYEYAVGTNLTVKAKPNQGNSLAYWVLNDQTLMQNPLLVTVDHNMTLQAVFVSGGLSGWTKTFGGEGTDQANAIIQTSDGGYAVAGWTDSFGAGSRDFYLIKTDANGNSNWNRQYGGPRDDEAYAIVQTADEGFAIAGRTGSGIAGSYDAWLVKTDEQGNMQWSQAYGGSGDDCAYSILATATGYVLGGYTTSAGSVDFWLLSVNSTGGLEWSRTYGDPGWSATYSMIQTSDGGYALAGYTNSSVSGFWLVKTDSLGNEEWNATYAGGIDGACLAMQTNDGGYAIAGTTVQGVGASEFYLVKATGDGAFQWSQTYDGPGYAHAYCLAQNPDGYLLAGSVYSFSGDYEKVFVVKTDVSGNALLNRTFGYPGYCATYSMVSRGNDEFVMAGTASFPERGTGGFDVLVMDVVVSTQCSLAIIDGPGGHTSPDAGTYVNGYMENMTVTAVADSGYMLDQWLLDGNSYGGQDQITITLDGNHVLQPLFAPVPTSLTLTINATAGGTTSPPPGNYTYGYNASVTVTAIPDSGYIFDYWTSVFGFMGNQNPNTIMMVKNVSLEAVFEDASSAQRTLTITTAAGGTTDPPPGNYTYGYMTNVTVTAIPDAGHVFDHWTSVHGENLGTQNPWNLTISSDFTIQPVFENATSGLRTLTIWSSVSKGTTNPPPGTYMCNYGESVTVTAIPQNGIYFAGWVLDQTSGGMSNPITITMDRSHDLGPNFGPNPPFNVTVTISPATGGTTDPASGRYTYPAGNQAKVTAIPDSGWWLDHWLLDGSNFGNWTSIEFNLDGNHTVRPVFASNTLPASFMLAINGADGGTTDPSPGTYEHGYGENVTVTATPNSGCSFKYWIDDGQNVNENPITVQMTQDHTLQPVFTGSQGKAGQGSQGQGGQGGLGINLNIPPSFILVGTVVIMAFCSVGYLVPLALAMKKGKVPVNIKKPRLILTVVSILIIVGPLGATLLAYRGNLNRVFTPSNVDELNNVLSSQGGMMNFNVTSSWGNLTSRTFGMLFNFTNPTATDLTLIVFSANLTDHSDGYPLGQISLASPVTAGANETVTFQVTSVLSEEAAGHVATAHAGAQSFAVDLSSVNINFAGILLQMNGTSTVNNLLIVR
ncbi:MAG: hypothetical protein ABR962_08805 [Candidatus Bathyarchaeia archaeon]